jgi:hypothetical protein
MWGISKINYNSSRHNLLQKHIQKQTCHGELVGVAPFTTEAVHSPFQYRLPEYAYSSNNWNVRKVGLPQSPRLSRLGGTRTLFVPHRRTPHPRARYCSYSVLTRAVLRPRHAVVDLPAASGDGIGEFLIGSADADATSAGLDMGCRCRDGWWAT